MTLKPLPEGFVLCKVHTKMSSNIFKTAYDVYFENEYLGRVMLQHSSDMWTATPVREGATKDTKDRFFAAKSLGQYKTQQDAVMELWKHRSVF